MSSNFGEIIFGWMLNLSEFSSQTQCAQIGRTLDNARAWVVRATGSQLNSDSLDTLADRQHLDRLPTRHTRCFDWPKFATILVWLKTIGHLITIDCVESERRYWNLPRRANLSWHNERLQGRTWIADDESRSGHGLSPSCGLFEQTQHRIVSMSSCITIKNDAIKRRKATCHLCVTYLVTWRMKKKS